jgi:hypothetical protein
MADEMESVINCRLVSWISDRAIKMLPNILSLVAIAMIISSASIDPVAVKIIQIEVAVQVAESQCLILWEKAIALQIKPSYLAIEGCHEMIPSIP